MLCFVLLCFALLCFALLGFALQCFALLCFVLLCSALLCVGTAPPRHFSSHGLQLHPPLTSPRSVLCIYIHSCIYSSAFPFSRYSCHRHKSTRFSLRRRRLQSISQPLPSKHAKICTVHPMLLPKMFKKQDEMFVFFGTLPPIFSLKMFKKQDEMLAFFCFFVAFRYQHRLF